MRMQTSGIEFFQKIFETLSANVTFFANKSQKTMYGKLIFSLMF